METIAAALVSALVAGATVAAKETASQAIKDAYRALKELIGSRMTMLARLEKNPSSVTAAAAAKEEAIEQNLIADATVVAKAREINTLILSEPAERLPEGIDLQRLRAGTDILVTDNTTSVRALDLEAGGRIEIKNNMGKQ